MANILKKYKASFKYLNYSAKLRQNTRKLRNITSNRVLSSAFTVWIDVFNKNAQVLKLCENIHLYRLKKRFFHRFTIKLHQTLKKASIKHDHVVKAHNLTTLTSFFTQWSKAFILSKKTRTLNENLVNLHKNCREGLIRRCFSQWKQEYSIRMKYFECKDLRYHRLKDLYLKIWKQKVSY